MYVITATLLILWMASTWASCRGFRAWRKSSDANDRAYGLGDGLFYGVISVLFGIVATHFALVIWMNV